MPWRDRWNRVVGWLLEQLVMPMPAALDWDEERRERIQRLGRCTLTGTPAEIVDQLVGTATYEEEHA